MVKLIYVSTVPCHPALAADTCIIFIVRNKYGMILIIV